MGNFKEIDIEDFIWDRLGDRRSNLRSRGLMLLEGVFYRQLKLPDCGIPDLVCFTVREPMETRVNPWLIIDVYELKRGHVEPKCLTQLLKYMSFFNEHKDGMIKRFGREVEIMVRGYLVGRTFDKEVLCINSASMKVKGLINFVSFKVGFEQGIEFFEEDANYYSSGIDFDEFMPARNFKWISQLSQELTGDNEEEEDEDDTDELDHEPSESISETEDIPF
jgi:hypothetical protein